MGEFKTTSFKILFDTISLFVIRFSTHDSNIKINENEKILKTRYKEKKHTINQVREKSTTFSIARELCSYTEIVNKASFLKMRRRFI